MAMVFLQGGSPLILTTDSVPAVMGRVLLAMVPGIITLVWLFGAGVLVQLLIASAAALSAEALCLRLRRRPAIRRLGDGSALLTGCLLAVSLPPLLPWWMTVLGAGFAIVVAKQLYGGLGHNPFNPAMVGYVVLLVSFPLAMSTWVAPDSAPGLPEAGAIIFSQTEIPDAYTGATPLDRLRTAQAQDLAAPHSALGWLGGQGWEWVNLAFLAGGLWLLSSRTAAWQIPAGMLGVLGTLSGIAFLLAPGRFHTPWLHLFSGATMLGAFFIATDPVSASTTPRGRWFYGAGIGVLVWVIRSLGGYPDGMAFAVLLMNIAAPTLDNHTRSRVHGR